MLVCVPSGCSCSVVNNRLLLKISFFHVASIGSIGKTIACDDDLAPKQKHRTQSTQQIAAMNLNCENGRVLPNRMYSRKRMAHEKCDHET